MQISTINLIDIYCCFNVLSLRPILRRPACCCLLPWANNDHPAVACFHGIMTMPASRSLCLTLRWRAMCHMRGTKMKDTFDFADGPRGPTGTYGNENDLGESPIFIAKNHFLFFRDLATHRVDRELDRVGRDLDRVDRVGRVDFHT